MNKGSIPKHAIWGSRKLYSAKHDSDGDHKFLSNIVTEFCLKTIITVSVEVAVCALVKQ